MIIRRFSIILSIVIIIAFILFQPTMASLLPYPSRDTKAAKFLEEITSGDRIDARLYWQKREHYFPGTFYFDKEGNDIAHFNAIMQKSGIDVQQQKVMVLARYTSPTIISDESIIDTKTAATMISEIKKRQEGENVIKKGENYIVIEENNKKIYLLFVASHEEMMRSNGFAAENKKLVADKSWLSISEITL